MRSALEAPSRGSEGSPGSDGITGFALTGTRVSPGPKSSTTSSWNTPVASARFSMAFTFPARFAPMAASEPSTSVRMPSLPTIWPRKKRYDFAANAMV